MCEPRYLKCFVNVNARERGNGQFPEISLEMKGFVNGSVRGFERNDQFILCSLVTYVD